jgi:hypothetical protein
VRPNQAGDAVNEEDNVVPVLNQSSCAFGGQIGQAIGGMSGPPPADSALPYATIGQSIGEGNLWAWGVKQGMLDPGVTDLMDNIAGTAENADRAHQPRPPAGKYPQSEAQTQRLLQNGMD